MQLSHVRASRMKVGDLVKHVRLNTCYLVAKVDNPVLIGLVTQTGEIKYIARSWLEVISESR